MSYMTPEDAIEAAMSSVRMAGLPLPAEFTAWARQAIREGWIEQFSRQWLLRDRALRNGWPDPFGWVASGAQDSPRCSYDPAAIARLHLPTK